MARGSVLLFREQRELGLGLVRRYTTAKIAHTSSEWETVMMLSAAMTR